MKIEKTYYKDNIKKICSIYKIKTKDLKKLLRLKGKITNLENIINIALYFDYTIENFVFKKI